MKKVTALLAVVSIVLVFGCGPKSVSRQTLNALSSTKAAAEAAEVKAKELEQQRIQLEKEKNNREATVKKLEQELEAIKTRTGGY